MLITTLPSLQIVFHLLVFLSYNLVQDIVIENFMLKLPNVLLNLTSAVPQEKLLVGKPAKLTCYRN